MQKKLLLLSASLILTSLASCGGNTPSSSSAADTSAAGTDSVVTSEEATTQEETSSGEQKAGRVIICLDEETADLYDLEVLRTDIALEGTVDLEKHVKVTNVPSWSIEAKTDNVTVNGHTFTATGYGAYTITIIAGTTRRAINGQVVTENKIKFNEVFDQLDLQYMVSGDIPGAVLVHDNYWMEARQSSSGVPYMFGGIDHPTNEKTYSFNLEFVDDDFADTIDVNKGLGRSVRSKGFGKYYENFEEVISSDFVQMFDSDGEATGYFVLENPGNYEYGESNVSRFIDALCGDDVWSTYQEYLLEDPANDILHLAAKYSAKTGTISFYPMSDTGTIIKNLTIGQNTYKTVIELTSVNDTEVAACEKWIADPVTPEAIDITPIRNAFDNIFEQKNFTFHGYAQWYNPSSPDKTAIDVPSGMKFSDGDEVFPNYDTHVYVTENIAETVFDLSAPRAYLPPNVSLVIPATGDRELFFVHENYARTANFTNGAWGDVTTGSEPFSEEGEGTIWDSTMVPYFFQSDFKNDILGQTSIYEYAEVEGAKVFAYNTYGGDMDYGDNKYYAGIPFFLATLVPSMFAYIPVFYMAYMGWYEYSDMAFTVFDNGDVSFDLEFVSSSSAALHMGFTFEAIGTTVNSDGAINLYNNFINPQVPEESSSQEGSQPVESGEVTSEESQSVESGEGTSQEQQEQSSQQE